MQNHTPPNRTHGTLPEESSFVQAARENLPEARVRLTTATARRGTSRKRQAHGSTSEMQDGQQGGGRARSANNSVHDLNTLVDH